MEKPNVKIKLCFNKRGFPTGVIYAVPINSHIDWLLTLPGQLFCSIKALAEGPLEGRTRMTTLIFRWKLLCSIAICLVLNNVSKASSDLDSSLRLSAPHFSLPNSANFVPGKMVCSLAGTLIDTQPAKNWSATSSAQYAPTVNAKPVDVAIDQFSSHKFGQIGFTPQCLFVDHSVPRGYLETKIVGTFEPSDNPIYDTSDIRVDHDSRNLDRYWQYYSDCDSWDVVFRKLPAATPQTRTNHLRVVVSQIQEVADFSYQSLVQLQKQLEFVSIESEGIDTAPRLSEVIIDRLRRLRPVLDIVPDRDFVLNWIEMKQCWLESELHGTLLASIWDRLPPNRLDEPVEVELPAKTFRKQLHWIAREIEELLSR